jgi:hypothetical protein
MSGIICALRGGLDSRATITRAVAMAQEVSLPVHFLYVVNRELVSDTAVRDAHTVVDQLRKMGNSIVLVAQAIANSHGIPAQGAVRYGCVEDEINGLVHDVDADYLILSQPHGQRETNAFTPERLARFKARVEREAGVKVVLAEGDGP